MRKKWRKVIMTVILMKTKIPIFLEIIMIDKLTRHFPMIFLISNKYLMFQKELQQKRGLVLVLATFFFCVGRFLAKFEYIRCQIISIILQPNDSFFFFKNCMYMYNFFPKMDKCEGLFIKLQDELQEKRWPILVSATRS